MHNSSLGRYYCECAGAEIHSLGAHPTLRRYLYKQQNKSQKNPFPGLLRFRLQFFFSSPAILPNPQACPLLSLPPLIALPPSMVNASRSGVPPSGVSVRISCKEEMPVTAAA